MLEIEIFLSKGMIRFACGGSNLNGDMRSLERLVSCDKVQMYICILSSTTEARVHFKFDGNRSSQLNFTGAEGFLSLESKSHSATVNMTEINILYFFR